MATVLLGAALVSAATPTLPAHTYTTGSSYGAPANTASYGYLNGYATWAKFKGPWGTAYDITTGNLVVTDYSDNRIRRISSGGTVSTFAGSGASGSADGTGEAAVFYFPAGVSITSAGVTYVADRGNHKVRQISSTGAVTTLAGSGAAGASNGVGFETTSFYYPQGVAAFNDTEIYVADTNNNLIRKIVVFSNGNVNTTTLSGSGTYGTVDGINVDVAFMQPRGLAVTTTRVVFVADTNAHAIRKVATNGITTTIAGAPNTGSGLVNADGIAARFYNPYDVSVNADGYIFVADTNNNVIRIVSPLGNLSTVTTATLSSPRGVHVTSTGTVYITSYTTERILAYTGSTIAATPSPAADSLNGTTPMLPVMTYITGSKYGASSSTASYGDTNGDVTLAKFKGPWGVAYDVTTGSLVIADYFDNRIRRVSATDSVSTFAGSGVSGSADGLGEAATFYFPAGISVDGAGVSYVGDKSNNKVRSVSAVGEVRTLAGTGNAAFADGVAVVATFWLPHGVSTYNGTWLFVADSTNHRIRKVALFDGTTSTHAGSGAYGIEDGYAADCAFKNPGGVSASVTGVVYVADTASHAIRKIATNGWVTTLAGISTTGASESGLVDAVGPAARFNTPFDLSVDANGYVWVADSDNNAVRVVSPGGNVTTAWNATQSTPRGIHVTSAGSVYIACFNSEKIMAYTGGTPAPTAQPATAPPNTTAAPASAFTVSTALAVLAAAIAVVA
jgi:hypothetical protein